MFSTDRKASVGAAEGKRRLVAEPLNSKIGRPWWAKSKSRRLVTSGVGSWEARRKAVVGLVGVADSVVVG